MIVGNALQLSVVDDDGRFTEAAGLEFHGAKVSTEECTEQVLERIARDVLHIETFTHSYPYDWRTKQPVVVRASDQWFIDINSVREKIIVSNLSILLSVIVLRICVILNVGGKGGLTIPIYQAIKVCLLLCCTRTA